MDAEQKILDDHRGETFFRAALTLHIGFNAGKVSEWSAPTTSYNDAIETVQAYAKLLPGWSLQQHLNRPDLADEWESYNNGLDYWEDPRDYFTEQQITDVFSVSDSEDRRVYLLAKMAKNTHKVTFAEGAIRDMISNLT